MTQQSYASFKYDKYTEHMILKPWLSQVGLGVTTVLTMTTLISSTDSALPKISYVKSIDVYLAACFFMVFASLLGKWFITNMTNNFLHTFKLLMFALAILQKSPCIFFL